MIDVALGAIVTFNPQSVPAEMRIADALRLMNELGVHHLPITQDCGRVVGIVSHRDLLARCRNANDRVEQVMVRTVFTVDVSSSPAAAVRAILDHAFHSVPVLDEGNLIGMVTSTDFLRELSYGAWAVGDEAVGAHMVALTGEDLLFTAATEIDAVVDGSSVVSAEQTLADAAALMLEYGVQELPVVDERGGSIGVLRDLDLLRAIAVELG